MLFHLPRPTVRLRHAVIALSLIAAPTVCTARQDKSPGARPVQEPAPPAPTEAPDPMASFARMVGGEWKVTFSSGMSAFDSWAWGPGKHSMRGGELEVMYWHPGRKQVCLLSLHADIPGVGRGAGEGTIKFEGETASGLLDLYQPRGLRKLATRWTFDGPDKYHDELLEDTGTGFKPQNQWDRFRVPKRAEAPPRTAEEAPKLPEHLKAFEALLGRTWEAKGGGDLVSGESFPTQATFEFVPDYVYARVLAPSKDGEPEHVLDAYVYQHVRTGVLRCLALSNRDVGGGGAGVYEGDVTVLDGGGGVGGALQFDLKGYEDDQVAQRLVRFDFEQDGTLHHRVWSTTNGTERTLMLDTHHRKLEPKKD